MSTHTLPYPTEQVSSPRAREQDTAPMQPGATEPIVDSFGWLDHRTQRRAISRRLAPRGPYLALQDGGEERLVPLESKITHIGRGTASEVRLEEQRVSRSHAIVVRYGRFARLLDNRSANGTFVNGRPIVATNISDGDVIAIGPVAMRYVEVR